MCTQGRTLLGQMGLHITNGEQTREIDRSRFRLRCKVFRVMREWGSTSIGILLLGMSACSPLDSMFIESEMSDFQLTMDTLKASLQDAQRTIAELRAEVDARRLELADVQITRAQLEGRIREADRRLTEAHHVIDLQREELASSRSEREQGELTRSALQNQLKQLQKQLSKVGKQERNVSPAAMAFPRDGQFEQDALLAAQKGDTTAVRGPAIHVSGASSLNEAPRGPQSATVVPSIQVIVKSGDTLWSIARRYHTSVRRLLVRNALPSDRIQVGQALWITVPPIEEFEHERM